MTLEYFGVKNPKCYGCDNSATHLCSCIWCNEYFNQPGRGSPVCDTCVHDTKLFKYGFYKYGVFRRPGLRGLLSFLIKEKIKAIKWQVFLYKEWKDACQKAKEIRKRGVKSTDDLRILNRAKNKWYGPR